MPGQPKKPCLDKNKTKKMTSKLTSDHHTPVHTHTCTHVHASAGSGRFVGAVVWGFGAAGGAFSGRAAGAGRADRAARPPPRRHSAALGSVRSPSALASPRRQAQHGAGGVGVPEPEPASGRLGGDAALRGRDGQTLAPPPRVPAPQCRGPGPRHARGSCGRRGEWEPPPATPAARLLLHGLGQPRLPRVPVPSKGYG